MNLIRYSIEGGAPAVGLLDGDRVLPLTSPSMGEFLSKSIYEIRAEINSTGAESVSLQEVAVLPPIDGRTEVWASGVTYLRSRESRMEESSQSRIYEQVYAAARPELFMKAPSWRVVPPAGRITIRSDSLLNIPEPELAVIANAGGQVVGYCVSNDMSSRSIEAENPLYLPQAKIYDGSCVLSGGIALPGDSFDPMALTISCTVERNGATVWSGMTSTDQMKRPVSVLLEYLFSHLQFPEGVVLSTGTGIVPPLDFSLLPMDRVAVDISGVGRIENEVALRSATATSPAEEL